MNQGHTAEEGEKSLVGVLDGLKAQPVGSAGTEKAKNQEIAGFILGRDTDEEKAVALASAAVIGKDPGLVNTELDHYLTASAADIQRVAKDYFQSAARDGADRHAGGAWSARSARATMTPRAMRKTFSGATMKRVTSQSLFLIAVTMFAAAAAAAFAPVRNCTAASLAPPVSRSETEPASSQGPEKASGIVPPGVKLAPEMPAAGRAAAI